MARTRSPGAQAASIQFRLDDGRQFSLTAQGDITYARSKIKREELDDAHTPVPLTRIMHKRGRFSVTPVTDQDLSWLDEVENARATLQFLNGRTIAVTGVTMVAEDGVVENLVQGTAEEIPFIFVKEQDRDVA